MTAPRPSLKRLGQRLRYEGRKFAFEATRLRLPNGTEGEFEAIRHPGGAMAVPLTRDGRYILVEQYRFALDAWLLEFPAGTREAGEEPVATIRRELEEEIGFRAGTWSDLGTFPLAPGYSDEYIHAFLAQGLEPLEEPPAQDPDEDLRTIILSEEELREAILTGRVDAKSISAFHLTQGHDDKGLWRY